MRDSADPGSADPCPKSAVSHGVGIAGLIGLCLWTLVARHYGMNGPHAGLAAVVACGVPMVLWSLVIWIAKSMYVCKDINHQNSTYFKKEIRI